MNLVSQGELKLEEKSATDVDAARPTEAYGNSNWSDEFLAQDGNGLTHHPGSSSDWASEFLSEPATSAAPSQPAADQWVEEFSGGKASADIFRVADPPTQQDDFWSQLQSDWDKAAEENPSKYHARLNPLIIQFLLLLPFFPIGWLLRNLAPSLTLLFRWFTV